ncbi:MAG: oligosaccharide flippase family protein, partial [Vicingaceae bacterium]
FTSLSGTTLSQVITIGMAPILTRIYLPADYGLLGIYMSITAILFVFTTLQYSQAILLTNSKKEENAIIKICSLTTIIYSLLIAITILFFDLLELNLFTSSKLKFWLYFIPFSTLLFGFNTILSKLLNKYKKYKALSITQIFSSITTVLISLILGLSINNFSGLLIALIAGQLIRFFSLITLSKQFLFPFNNPSKELTRKTIIKFKKFPLYTIPTEFLFGWTNQLPIYFFNSYFNTTVIGHFNYGKRMVSLPISFITGAVGNVFAQKAAEQYNKTGECRNIFINTFKMLALPILPFFIILGIFAPTLFSFIFGSEWLTAGTYVQILTPMFYLKAIVSPLSYMYIIKNKQDEDMVLHIVSFAIIAFSFFVGYQLNSDINTILIFFSFSYCLIYIYTIIRSYQFSKI